MLGALRIVTSVPFIPCAEYRMPCAIAKLAKI